MIDRIWLINILLIACIAMFFLVVYLFVKQRKAEKKSRLLEIALRKEINAMSSSTIGMGKQIIDIEKKLDSSLEKQLELEQRDPDDVIYSQAARLVEMGANVDDIVHSCGIGRPEAELMALMHKELSPKQTMKNIRRM